MTNLWPPVWLRVKAGEVDALVTVLADDKIFALVRAAFIHFTEKFHNFLSKIISPMKMDTNMNSLLLIASPTSLTKKKEGRLVL